MGDLIMCVRRVEMLTGSIAELTAFVDRFFDSLDLLEAQFPPPKEKK